MAIDLSSARAGSCCRQLPPCGGASSWRSSLRHEVLPILLAGAATLVHHAHELLQRAHVARGQVLLRLVLAAVGVVHVEVLEHEANLGAVEYDLALLL
eukprot:6211833-Pleurochrysis_carterae.AAC.1